MSFGDRIVELLEMRWPQVAALDKNTPVVFPIAALEQHGHHMPVFTDSLLLGEVMRRTKEQIADRVLFAPLQWLGNSHHHLDFAGTMSASCSGWTSPASSARPTPPLRRRPGGG